MRGKPGVKAMNIAETLSTYLNRSGLDYRQIARRTMKSDSAVARLFEEGALPSDYPSFKKICDIIGVPESILDEFAKTESAYIFTYWKYVRPDATPLDFSGRFLELKCIEKGLSRQDIVDATGITAPVLSVIFRNKSTLTWATLCTILDAIDVSPSDFLKEYENSTDKALAIRFSDYVKRARKRKGLSIHDAAEICGMTQKKYEKIEAGGSTVQERELKGIAEALEVDYKMLVKYADSAGIFYPTRPSSAQTRKIWDLLGALSAYEKIETDDGDIESHTLIVLVFLILLNRDDRYETDIRYYLNCLRHPGNLSLGLYAPPDGKDMNELDVLNHVRKLQGYTYAGLAKKAGLSASSVYDYLNGITNTPYIKTIISISDTLGTSLTLSLENIAGEDAPKYESADMTDIIATIKTSADWEFEGTSYPSDKLEGLFDIIFSDNLTPEKYDDIIKLGF